MREARAPRRAQGRDRPRQEGMRADGSLEIRFLRASRPEEAQRPDRARGARGARRRGLPSAQEPLRLPAHRPRTAKKRHRREREARAPYHAKARTRRKGRDPKTPHPEEGRAGRPPVEPGGARFLRGRAQQALGGRYHLHTHKRRVALSRSRDRRLLPQGRGRSMSERITEKAAIDAIGQAVGREDPPDDGSLVFHGERGAQHASRSFRRCLGSHGTAQSASRPGTPPDNAACRVVLQDAEKGIGGREELWDEGRGQAGHLQAHRALLQ